MVQTKKLADFNIRPLGRSEVTDIWQIDRSEIIEEMYRLQDDQLVLEPQFYDVRGWPEGEAEIYTPILLDCYDHGGVFLGAEADGALVAVAVTDVRPVGLYPVSCMSIKPSVDWALQANSIGAAWPLLRKPELKAFIFQRRPRGEQSIFI